MFFEESVKHGRKFSDTAQSAAAVEYTDCIYAEVLDTSLTSILDMTLNN